MSQSSAQKLGMKPQTTTLVLGSSPADVASLLGDLPDGAVVVDRAESADLVLLFADDVASVRSEARAAFGRTAAAGRLWIAYRKGANRKPAAGTATPLHRDTLQATLAELALDGVSLISLDETWSAMRVKAV